MLGNDTPGVLERPEPPRFKRLWTKQILIDESNPTCYTVWMFVTTTQGH